MQKLWSSEHFSNLLHVLFSLGYKGILYLRLVCFLVFIFSPHEKRAVIHPRRIFHDHFPCKNLPTNLNCVQAIGCFIFCALLFEHGHFTRQYVLTTYSTLGTVLVFPLSEMCTIEWTDEECRIWLTIVVLRPSVRNKTSLSHPWTPGNS